MPHFLDTTAADFETAFTALLGMKRDGPAAAPDEVGGMG